jgi:hypothetical protein
MKAISHITAISDDQVRDRASNHEVLPKRGTIRRERDNSPTGQPIMPWDYPILAECVTCGKNARRNESLLADWQHIDN